MTSEISKTAPQSGQKIKVLYVTALAIQVQDSSDDVAEYPATLDLETGKIEVDIGSLYSSGKQCIGAEIRIAAFDRNDDMAFKLDSSNSVLQLPAAELERIRSTALFQVLTCIGNDSENTTTRNDVPVYYATKEAAIADLTDMLLSVIDAVENGRMDEECDPADYLIHDLANDIQIAVVWASSSKQKLVSAQSIHKSIPKG